MTERVYSGGAPDAEGLRELEKLSVQTIISVDGARPPVDAAKALAMRYIHVPICYDEISAESAASVVKALREVDGKVYIHCHHGKHRGPAMAAIRTGIESGARRRGAQLLVRGAGRGIKW